VNGTNWEVISQHVDDSTLNSTRFRVIFPVGKGKRQVFVEKLRQRHEHGLREHGVVKHWRN